MRRNRREGQDGEDTKYERMVKGLFNDVEQEGGGSETIKKVHFRESN